MPVESFNPSLLELLARWEDLRREGRAITAEELCADCPELLAEFRRRAAELEAVNVRLDTPAQADGGWTTLPPSSGGAASAAPPGSIAGRYRPLHLHAQGGLGEVHRAEDVELHREVALKRIQPEFARDSQSRSRFLIEAEITARLEHPGIVPVYGLVHDEQGQPQYAMRFIEGETLDDAIQRYHQRNTDDPVAFRQLLAQFVTVCKTIAYAHDRGVIHRDIKPRNVMLGKYGETLVVDWGLAKSVGRTEEKRQTGVEKTLAPELDTGAVRTRPGKWAGTPQYMSPEQAAGAWEIVDQASDIYSLGATLYVLLTGRAPFADISESERLRLAIQQGEFVRPRDVKSGVPRALEAVCMKAMARKGEGRYSTALDLAQDVERWLADEPVGAHREPLHVRVKRWGRRHRTTAALAAVVPMAGILAFAITIALVSREQAETKKELEAKLKAERHAHDNAQKAQEELVARLKAERSLEVLTETERARTLSKLGSLNQSAGRFGEAKQLYEQALKLAGADVQQLAVTKANLAFLHAAQKEWKPAFERRIARSRR